MVTLLGWLGFGLSCAWVVVNAAARIPSWRGGPGAAMAAYFVAEALFLIGFTGVGAIVLSREPDNRIGLLLLIPALLPLSGGLNAMIAWADQRGLPTGWADGLLAAISSATFFEGLVALLLLLIPTGRPPDRRWRPVVVLVTAATAVSFAQSFLLGLPRHSALPPLPLSPPWAPMIGVSQVIGVVNEFIIRAGIVAGVASLVYRVLTAQGQKRAQVAWILFGAGLWMLTTAFPGVFLSIFVPGLAASPSNLEFFIPLGVLAVVVTCGIAILHHDLVQLNPLLRRMLTILVAVMALTAGYLGLRTWLGDGPVAAALTAMGMALVSPLLYRWLQGAMTWLVYGRRSSPAATMGLLGRYAATQMIRGIARAADPDQVLAVLADAIHRTIPGTVDVVLTSDGRELRRVSRGGPQPHDAPRERVPLIFQRNELGWVDVSGAVRLTPADRALLGDLASAAAAPLAAAHRSAELQRAHRELITAREQERRRIARDLHDGVGPVLSGLGFALDTLRARITDPDLNLAARNARGLVREALQLVRRVSRELRPVGLDQLGLAGSVQELGARYTGPGLTVTVDAGELGELCAATEVAAYAITAEALTNVARHAHATRCEVTLQRGPEAVEITVNDNGTGLSNTTIGIGSTSMHERARELGGWCHISTGTDGRRTRPRAPTQQPPRLRTDRPTPWTRATPVNAIRVVVVDDHAVVRDGLRALLTTHEHIDVVGVAADGLQAIQVIHECQPDVVLMDLGMPQMGGVEATRRILSLHPTTHVIALTMSDDDTTVLAAIRAGARGYLLKDADGDEIVAAIRPSPRDRPSSDPESPQPYSTSCTPTRPPAATVSPVE